MYIYIYIYMYIYICMYIYIYIYFFYSDIHVHIDIYISMHVHMCTCVTYRSPWTFQRTNAWSWACNTLQYTTTRWNALQHTATHFQVLSFLTLYFPEPSHGRVGGGGEGGWLKIELIHIWIQVIHMSVFCGGDGGAGWYRFHTPYSEFIISNMLLDGTDRKSHGLNSGTLKTCYKIIPRFCHPVCNWLYYYYWRWS